MTDVSISLEDQVKLLRAELAALEATRKQGFKATVKKIGRGVWAGLTTSDAVKLEKSLVAAVLVRLAMTLPAYAVLIDLLLKALGAPSVSP